MRAHLRCIAVGFLLAGSLALDCAFMGFGAVPVAHAQRWRGSPDYQPPPDPGPTGEKRDCGAVGASLFIFLALVLTLSGNKNDRATEANGPAAMEGPSDVTVLRVAVGWRERRFLQGKLDDIARSADTSSAPGLVRMLRQVTLVLRRARDTWLYAGIVNAEPMRAREAQKFFQQHARETRTRSREAPGRNPVGVRATRASGARDARPGEEGEGLAVITLIVSARGHLLDFHDLADAEQVRRCLESLGSLTSAALTAVEIVWTPAAEGERLSEVELERLFPDVQKIRGGSGAGRMHCASCAGPFPAELSSCPHCGARVSEQATS
jgi:uncharacterized membrane protein